MHAEHYEPRLEGVTWGRARKTANECVKGENISPWLNGNIWVFPKIGVGPQNGWFISCKTLLKLMIWGYHYFWKHPFTLPETNSKFTPENGWLEY